MKVTPRWDMCRVQTSPSWPKVHNGTKSWSWLPCLPHSDSSLAFNNTGPGPDNSTTTTTAELADNNSQRGTGLVWPDCTHCLVTPLLPDQASSDLRILDNVVMERVARVTPGPPGSVFTRWSRVSSLGSEHRVCVELLTIRNCYVGRHGWHQQPCWLCALFNVL